MEGGGGRMLAGMILTYLLSATIPQHVARQHLGVGLYGAREGDAGVGHDDERVVLPHVQHRRVCNTTMPTNPRK